MCEGDADLATHLLGVYALHGRLEEAMQVPSEILFRTATIGLPSSVLMPHMERLPLLHNCTDGGANQPFVPLLQACAIVPGSP